jgi:hypothetical protein
MTRNIEFQQPHLRNKLTPRQMKCAKSKRTYAENMSTPTLYTIQVLRLFRVRIPINLPDIASNCNLNHLKPEIYHNNI